MNWYLKAIHQYADFSGRARRQEYWMFFLFNMLFSSGLQILAVVADVPPLLFLYAIYILGVLLPSLAVGVRRMHDVGKSGWYLLIPIYSFILAVTEGDQGDNDYGKDPKATPDAILKKV